MDRLPIIAVLSLQIFTVYGCGSNDEPETFSFFSSDANISGQLSEFPEDIEVEFDDSTSQHDLNSVALGPSEYIASNIYRISFSSDQYLVKPWTLNVQLPEGLYALERTRTSVGIHNDGAVEFSDWVARIPEYKNETSEYVLSSKLAPKEMQVVFVGSNLERRVEVESARPELEIPERIVKELPTRPIAKLSGNNFNWVIRCRVADIGNNCGAAVTTEKMIALGQELSKVNSLISDVVGLETQILYEEELTDNDTYREEDLRHSDLTIVLIGPDGKVLYSPLSYDPEGLIGTVSAVVNIVDGSRSFWRGDGLLGITSQVLENDNPSEIAEVLIHELMHSFQAFEIANKGDFGNIIESIFTSEDHLYLYEGTADAVAININPYGRGDSSPRDWLLPLNSSEFSYGTSALWESIDPTMSYIKKFFGILKNLDIAGLDPEDYSVVSDALEITNGRTLADEYVSFFETATTSPFTRFSGVYAGSPTLFCRFSSGTICNLAADPKLENGLSLDPLSSAYFRALVGTDWNGCESENIIMRFSSPNPETTKIILNGTSYESGVSTTLRLQDDFLLLAVVNIHHEDDTDAEVQLECVEEEEEEESPTPSVDNPIELDEPQQCGIVPIDGERDCSYWEDRANTSACRVLASLACCSHVCTSPSQIPTTPVFSDQRIKQNIQVVGSIERLGLSVYAWRYRNNDPIHYVGIMAQDLLKRADLSHAVTTIQGGPFTGYHAVDYSILGLQMTTMDQWQIHGIVSIDSAH
jgi:hypothetical protein